MNSKIMRRLATNPKAMIDLRTSGRMPRTVQPEKTPLWRLLDSLGPRERSRYIGVRLSPTLGYHSDQVFPSAEALFRALGGRDIHGEWEIPPLAQRAIRGFHGALTDEDLKKHSANYPHK